MNIEKVKMAIDIAKLIDDDVEQVAADGRPVIVRSRDNGVMFGNYASNHGSTVSLTNAVQMWRWKAVKGGTLVDCAEFGVDKSGCKFSHGQAAVTIFGACALIDCSPKAAKSIMAVDGGDWQ